jgi:uncharacterized protein involved in exopolysaccharide biosynthesis
LPSGQALKEAHANNDKISAVRIGKAYLAGTAKTVWVPDLRTQLLSLDRTYALAQEKYRVLQQKQVLASVTEATSRAAVKSMRVVEFASPPDEARWPKLKYLYPGALLVGLILGVPLVAIALLLIAHARPRVPH